MATLVTVKLLTEERPNQALILAPGGIASSLGGVSSVQVRGGDLMGTSFEQRTGQPALLIRPTAAEVAIDYELHEPTDEEHTPRYPLEAFLPFPCMFTEAAAELADASIKIAREAGGGRKAVQALIDEASARFTYDHPQERFNDGHDEVPYLGCSVATGSCVDINTYLVASLRAAGLEAAYVYGYFFPEERNGFTVGMHCWVATRVEGVLEEWDIAHHKKMGTDTIGEGLNPKPGCRVVMGHSMSHQYQTPFGPVATKLLASPLWVNHDGLAEKTKIEGAWLEGDLLQASGPTIRIEK